MVDDTKVIEKSTDIIYGETEKIDKLAPTPEVKEHTSKIREETNKIKSTNDSIVSEISKVDVKKIESLEKKLGEYEAQDEGARLDAIKSVYGNLAFFFAVGFVMLVAGGFIVLYNRKLGTAALTIGFLTVGFAAGATFYMKYIAIIGLIIMLIGIISVSGMILWTILDAKKQKTANKENVELVQEIKDHLTPENKNKIFNKETGLVNKIHSPQTQKLIKKIKITKN